MPAIKLLFFITIKSQHYYRKVYQTISEEISRMRAMMILIQLLVLSYAESAAGGNTCSYTREDDIRKMHKEFRRITFTNPALSPAFMRAAFHDCITAHSSNELSGCNGSLKFELNDGGNSRLDGAVRVIEKLRMKKFPCISFADALQIAFAASSNVNRAGVRLKDVVDFKYGRVDVSEADFFNNEEQLDLPGPLSQSWDAQLAFYESKGFSAEDMVISLVVGHSIGGFSEIVFNANQEPVKTGRIIKFTEVSPNKVNADFCGNMLMKKRFGQNMPTFNTLPSDDALIGTNQGLSLLRTICRVETHGRKSFALRFRANRRQLKRKFRVFVRKMQALTGKALKRKGL